jgi:hypothetical protein
LDIIRGTAFDPAVATGVNRVELGIIRLKDKKYWDGSNWTSETSWLIANGTMKWEYNSKGVAWTSKEQYRILSRSIDNATNPETPSDGIIFTFDTDRSFSTIIIPRNNSYHNVLSSISGTSTDLSGSGVKEVEIAIKETSADIYWNGQNWVAAEIWLNAVGTNEWLYDSSLVIWTSGVHYIIYARAIDWLDNIEVPTTGNRIIIDKDGPISQIIHPGEGMLLNQLDLITGNASDHGGSGLDRIEVSIRRVSDNNYWDGTNWQTEIYWITAQGTNNWTYDSDQIPWTTDTYNTIFSNAIDKMGNKLAYWKGNTFMFDNKTPEQSFTINNNDKFTNSFDVNLTLASEDSGSGVTQMIFSNDGQKWSTWEPINDYKLFKLSSGDGIKVLYFKVQDRAGNIGEPATNSIILDTEPPECSIIINEDVKYTKYDLISLELNATDSNSGIDLMAFSFDRELWTQWKLFKNNEKLTLPEGDGVKTVYFRVIDKAGNIGLGTATIILDTTSPDELSIEINNGASETESKGVVLKLHAIDKTSGINQMCFSMDSITWSDWEDYSNSTTYNLTARSGEITIYFRVKDKAGNIANPTLDTIIFNEPVQPKKTNQDYWYLIIILIIIIFFIISAVVYKRKKKIPHKVPLVPAVTINPLETTTPELSLEKSQAVEPEAWIPAKPTVDTSQQLTPSTTPIPMLAKSTQIAQATVPQQTPTAQIPQLPQLPPAKIQETKPKVSATTPVPTVVSPPTTPTIQSQSKTPKVSTTQAGTTPKVAKEPIPSSGLTVHLPDSPPPTTSTTIEPKPSIAKPTSPTQAPTVTTPTPSVAQQLPQVQITDKDRKLIKKPDEH